MDVRRSQQIVKFDPCGLGWNVRDSVDENSSPAHTPKSFRTILISQAPEPTRSVSPTLPPRRSSRVLQPVSNVNELVLCKEIGKLETEIEALRKHAKAQDRLISGFCSLHVKSKPLEPK